MTRKSNKQIPGRPSPEVIEDQSTVLNEEIIEEKAGRVASGKNKGKSIVKRIRRIRTKKGVYTELLEIKKQ